MKTKMDFCQDWNFLLEKSRIYWKLIYHLKPHYLPSRPNCLNNWTVENNPPHTTHHPTKHHWGRSLVLILKQGKPFWNVKIFPYLIKLHKKMCQILLVFTILKIFYYCLLVKYLFLGPDIERAKITRPFNCNLWEWRLYKHFYVNHKIFSSMIEDIEMNTLHK